MEMARRRTTNERERENGSLVSSLHLILGEIVFLLGLMGVAVYAVINVLSPVLRNVFEVSVYQAKWALGAVIFLGLSGLFFQFGAFMKQTKRFSFTFYSFATCNAGASLLIQLVKILRSGFEWIGVEFLSDQPFAHDSIFITMGMVSLVFTSLFFLYSAIVLWKETKD